MDLQELRKSPHLSASAVNDYIDCSLRYRFARVDHLKPEFRPDVFVFGTAIHQALAEFYMAKMVGEDMPVEEIQARFASHWTAKAKEKKDIRYKDGKSFESLLAEGRTMLKAFRESAPDEDSTVVAVEEPFVFQLDGVPPIIGVYDLVLEDASDVITIVDHKTAAKAYSNADIDKNPQLTIYQMAAKSNGYSTREIVLRFDALIKTKIPKFEQYYTTRTSTDERRLARTIKAVWDGITKEVFIPDRSSWSCGGCPYKKSCNEWLER